MQNAAPRPGIPWTGTSHSSVRLDPNAPAGPPYATAVSQVPGASLDGLEDGPEALPEFTAPIAPKDLD